MTDTDSGQRRLRSDCVNAQAELSLLLADMQCCTFYYALAQLWSDMPTSGYNLQVLR